MVIYISATVALAQLDLEVAATKGESIKESTKKNLISQLNAYQKFCDRYRLPYFPIDNLLSEVKASSFSKYMMERTVLGSLMTWRVTPPHQTSKEENTPT